VEAPSSDKVTATETSYSNFDTLLDHVAEVSGEVDWRGFVHQDENDADDADENDEDDERL
jgi:hypothetical protein